MKLYLVLLLAFAALVRAQDETTSAVEPTQSVIEQPELITIQCQSGTYQNGALISSANETSVACTSLSPACQTKVEERTSGNVTNTIVWKTCKDEDVCNGNAELFNPRDCNGPNAESADFRICISCCKTDICNESLDIDDISRYVVPVDVAADTP